MPCLSAFCAERALPSGVFGPRDFAPFVRLASARALLSGDGRARRGAYDWTWREILDWRVGLEMAESPGAHGRRERQSNRI